MLVAPSLPVTPSAIPETRDTGLGGWLRLVSIPGLGADGQRKLLQAFGLPDQIFSRTAADIASVVGMPLARSLLEPGLPDEIALAIDWAAAPGNRILTLADEDYPQHLLNTEDPPVLLYAKGDVNLLQRAALAVVGSRNATRQGEQNAEAFAETLSQGGLTIASGLALGIDAAAHRGALRGHGSTIAVIGTGIDRIYPARNEGLAREVADRGLIISEFPLGTPPLAGNFPRRNRIIAGLALGCLVVEAADRSGSLITARLSAESGREVFAIPGSIHSPLSKGCHRLIKQGAKLVDSAQDILEELKWETVPETGKNPSISPETSPEMAQILDAMAFESVTIDVLAKRTGLTAETLLAILLALELDGHVAQVPGGLYQRLNQRGG